jgi:hypothetical protein
LKLVEANENGRQTTSDRIPAILVSLLYPFITVVSILNRFWKSFSELCLKKFSTNDNALKHFQGPNHRNRIVLMSRRREAENLICCDVCCCQLNTLKALELHMQSPKHLEKVHDLEEISELKRIYMQNRNASSSSTDETKQPNSKGP